MTSWVTASIEAGITHRGIAGVRGNVTPAVRTCGGRTKATLEAYNNAPPHNDVQSRKTRMSKCPRCNGFKFKQIHHFNTRNPLADKGGLAHGGWHSAIPSCEQKVAGVATCANTGVACGKSSEVAHCPRNSHLHSTTTIIFLGTHIADNVWNTCAGHCFHKLPPTPDEGQP